MKPRSAVVLGMILAVIAGSGASAGPMRAQRAPDGAPNFVSVCRFSHQAPDDPIVFPGRAGASHLHEFFANKSTNASSTADSLRAAGSTCQIAKDTAAYWVPTLYDDGQRAEPTHVRAYYLTGGKDFSTIKPFPAGLEVVTSDQRFIRWACVGDGEPGAGQQSIPTCPAGTHLVERVRFPDCWDGRNLDSPDHRAHMTFSVRRACPSSHPVPVPALSTNVHYQSDGGNVVLAPLGNSSMPHADFFNAWDQPTLERLVRECINAGRHCGARPPR